MKIIDLIEQNSVTFSCEIFPPKPHIPLDECKSVIKGIAKTNPDFISVTYGAGGSNSKRTIEIADHIQTQYQIPALAHLTCVASAKSDIASTLHRLKDKRITNILALRGNVPQGMNPEDAVKDYRYAYQLIEDIKSQGDFCVGAACYPEGHIECSRKMDDIDHLKRKVDCGCDFLTTQMFFDNQILYNFLYKTLAKGIHVPIVAGIMPVTNSSQIKRICQLSGTYLPERLGAMVEKFGDSPLAMKQAGIAYATEQIIDLIANGVKAIHLYTMNKPDIAETIVSNLTEILDKRTAAVPV